MDDKEKLKKLKHQYLQEYETTIKARATSRNI